MSLIRLCQIAEKFKTKLANDIANTPVDKLSYPEIAGYMQAAGIQFTGPSSDDHIGFTFNNVKYGMQILSSAYIRFAPFDNKNAQIWEVPPPQKTVKRDQYFGKDMPLILKMIINTIR